MNRNSVYNPNFNGKYINPNSVLSNNDVCNILDEIVKTPSENGNESPCGNKIIEICQKEGLNYEIVNCTDDRFNIMITLGANSYLDSKHGLLLHGHYDTVPFLDMIDPLNTKINNNKMWGRGSVDQKGGLVSALCSLIAIKRNNIKLNRSVCLACVIDEESEHRGSYELANSGVSADYGISTEPTGSQTALFGCRGTTPIEIIVKGKTAHAGMPSLGVNAIQMSLPLLEELFKIELPTMDLGELGILESTNCISLIQGGSSYNNVPGECKIIMDRRTIPGEDSTSALNQINEIISKVKMTYTNLEASAHIARPDWKWEKIISRGLNPTLTDINCKLFDYLSESAIESGIKNISKGIFHGYCDMDFMVNDLDIPTLVYGPGDANLCHNPNEEIDIDEVCQVSDVFCNLIEKICG